MILDTIDNIDRYKTLNKGFEKAIEFLLHPDLLELAPKEYEIDGKNVYAIVAKDIGRKKEEALLETHEKYIDIQFVLEGTDNMGWKPKARCKAPSTDYSHEKDIQFFKDEPDVFLPVKSKSYAIFFPEDAHMPMISSNFIHKLIVKIAL